MRRDAFQAEIYYGDVRGLPTVIVKIPNRLPEYPHRYPENRKTRLSTQRDAMRIESMKIPKMTSRVSASVSQTRRNATQRDAMRIEFVKIPKMTKNLERAFIESTRFDKKHRA